MQLKLGVEARSGYAEFDRSTAAVAFTGAQCMLERAAFGLRDALCQQLQR